MTKTEKRLKKALNERNAENDMLKRRLIAANETINYIDAAFRTEAPKQFTAWRLREKLRRAK